MKTRKKVFSLLMSLMLLMGIVTGSVSAAGPSTGHTGELPNPYDDEQQELTDEQLAMVELSDEHLKATKDSDGNVRLEIVDIEEFEQKIEESNYPIHMSEIQDLVDGFNSYLESPNEATTGGPNFAQVPVGGGAGGTIDTTNISCGDALTVIGLIHGGSYGAAAFMLGLKGNSAVVLPFLNSAAYAVASIVCD